MMTKMASLSTREAVEFQRQLNAPIRVYSIECGDLVEEVGNLEIYDGIAHGVKNTFSGGFLTEHNTTIPVSIVKDSDRIFGFTLQKLDNTNAYLMECHVSQLYQRQGKSREMLKAIKEVSFEKWQYSRLYLRAGIPRVDEGVVSNKDWRQKVVKYKGKQMTNLEKYWFKQKNCFPLTDFDSSAGADEFVIMPEK